jgi:uncharacterized protein YndB with AHSA1/START domain
MAAKPIPVIPPVVKKLTVDCTPEEAFQYFTADFSKWWPVATHSVIAYGSEFKDKPETAILEPRVGGRLFERARSGEEHLWGTVLAWEPPSRLVFSFHPGRDSQSAQTVEVRFTRAGAGTDVVLTHTGWELLGERAQEQREGYNRGWAVVFEKAYPEYVRSQK